MKIYRNHTIEEKIREISCIAVVMGDHYADQLYNYYIKKGIGYISSVESIADFAILFFNENLDIDWSEGEHIWDDEVVEFAKFCYQSLIDKDKIK